MRLNPKFGLLLVLAVAACEGRDPGAPPQNLWGAERTFALSPTNPVVSADGGLRVPENYRTELAFIGAWATVGGEDEKISSFHNVYASPNAIKTYRETGRFPDGTILIKELVRGANGFKTTGEIAWAGDIIGWFVMVKDAKGRFGGNPLWAEGWGWSFFDASDPNTTTSVSFEADCMACHTPARETDWVFTEGYPVLSVGN